MIPKEYGKWKKAYQRNISGREQSHLTVTKWARLFSSAVLHSCSRQQFQEVENVDPVLLPRRMYSCVLNNLQSLKTSLMLESLW